MKLLPVRWVTDYLAYTDHYTAQIMGVVLSVMPDTDGKYTATMSVPNHRPEIQKGFDTVAQAQAYAIDELLPRQLCLYFSQR